MALASLLPGAAPAIGIISAGGHFVLDSAQIFGNATLFDGATVQTGDASSKVVLRNGVRFELGGNSKARIWENRITVEKGVGLVSASPAFELNAAGLSIHTASANGRVGVQIGRAVQVTALSGMVRVSSTSGLLLAALPAGRGMTFNMQAGSAGEVTRTGCMVSKDGHYILQDDQTQEVVELSGTQTMQQNFRQNIGNRVAVTGLPTSARPAVAVASSVIGVSKVDLRETGGCLSVAAALDASTNPPAAGSTAAPSSAPAQASGGGGLSTGAKVGIIVAIAAGAGVGAALALTHSKSSTSP